MADPSDRNSPTVPDGDDELVDGAPSLGTRMGRYELEAVIGAGGMGVVFAARDPELDRVVAVKVLRSPVGRHEGQTMARLTHPNVIRVYDVGVAHGAMFVAMEYVAGGTLSSWLGAAPRSVDEIVAAFAQAGRGLAAAHDAGLVHRDVKPSNLLVADDGRVLVTDFGLARATAGDGDGGADARDRAIAVTSAAGTPAYMAPEQHEPAGAIDARADQFAFCVALWTALYGTAPFAGATAAELALATRRGALVAPTGEAAARVPARLRAALTRGLRAAPDQRFPSMRALLAALEPPPRRRPIRIAAAALVLAAAAAALALWARRGRDDAAIDPCPVRGDAFAGIWDDPARAAVEGAFHRTGLAYADAVLREVERQLDAHRAASLAMRRASCLATRVGGTQSDTMMDLRARCLDERARALAGFVGELRRADRATVDRAADHAAAIGDVAACADVASLARRAPLPADAGRRAAIAALERDLAAVRGRIAAGHGKDAVDDVTAAVARARALTYPPVLADALAAAAAIESERERPAQAASLLDESILEAEAGGDDVLRLDDESNLVRVLGYELERDADAQGHAQRAAALLARLGGDDRRAAVLAANRAIVDWYQGRYRDALARVAEALAAFTRLDPQGPDVVRTLHLRAIVEQELDDDAGAVASERAALDIATRALGADHPAVAQIDETLGGSLRKLGRYDEARVALERGLAIVQATAGPRSNLAADAETNLATLWLGEGRYDQAIAGFQRALAINIEVLGPDHARVADQLDNLGEALSNAGRDGEAVAALERAIAIHTAKFGADAPQTANSYKQLGGHYLHAGQPARARAAFAEAARALRASLGADTPLLARAYRGLGDAERALGHRAAALDAYQAAIAHLGAAEQALRPDLEAAIAALRAPR